MLAIAEEGSFTAAADALATVQSNVSHQVRQLEEELGAELFVRSRRGAIPTECGDAVLERARRIRRELEALRADLSMLQGLADRRGELRHRRAPRAGGSSPRSWPTCACRAPGVRLRVNEAASERLVAEVAAGEIAQAVVTEPVTDRRLAVETLMVEALVGVVPDGIELPPAPVPLARLARLGLVLPPVANPLRREVEALAEAQGVTLDVAIEVEGIRLIGDLVASGAGVSILPETAIPTEFDNLRTVAVAELPPRRLALVNPRDAYLSLADRALRDSLLDLVVRARPPSVLSPPEPGQ